MHSLMFVQNLKHVSTLETADWIRMDFADIDESKIFFCAEKVYDRLCSSTVDADEYVTVILDLGTKDEIRCVSILSTQVLVRGEIFA